MTVIVPEVPVIDPDATSVAVMVWLPDVWKNSENVPVPLVSTEFAGSFAEPSVLVKRTVPGYPFTVLLLTSRAVTVKFKATPAVPDEGAVTEK